MGKKKGKKQRARKPSKKKKKVTAVYKSKKPSIPQWIQDLPLLPPLKKNAHYRCSFCSQEYWFYPGAAGPRYFVEGNEYRDPNICPTCESIDFEWLNYDEFLVV